MQDTTAFILGRREQREADFMVTLYTEDFGLIRATAQGVRKSAAKLRGHLEPFSRSSVSLVEGRAGYRLTGSTLCDYYPEIRCSLARGAAAEGAAALVARTFFQEKDPILWRALEEFFSGLNHNELSPSQSSQALFWFSVRVLVLLGYRPSLDALFSETPRLRATLLVYENENLENVLKNGLPTAALLAVARALLRVFQVHTGELFNFFSAPILLEG
ncbi:MAG: DNA repair protein RecO [Candidatus Sungbacteria bacterium RIFCSPHIGHO2_02_FULL_49_12]|uniref:DNA repair protein RecO n=1 Tax=Candidatus Sungbacteria bacterium RIFCSPHIGHO2_02_FULL_49_12 TaxID=1802271 RepID=A0A1G2KNQ8_9BACT|nr:MAG: DNA repair protein RecO [Candidatus Sungbacteria bacterium RIFCSPHIGHO2_02_FULL_49_12]